MALRLLEHVEINKTIICKTNLHIGGSKDDIEIGAMDSPVIRDTVTRLPYIPGSSLKGKLRSMAEYKEGKIIDGNPHGCEDPECIICKIFGAHGNLRRQFGPTRILVRDAMITDTSKKKLEELESGSMYAGTKQEVGIDRKTGKANPAGPRTMEFVPAGTEFHLNIVLRIFEGDDKNRMVTFIETGIEELKKDAIGGAGTRGYGWIDIK